MPTLDSKYAPGAFPKTCSCGTVYDQAAWEALEWGFIQQPIVIDGERLADALEGRLCPHHGKLGSHVTVRLRE